MIMNNQSSTSCSCTDIRCSGCNMRYICASSPYCCICKDNSELLKRISNLESVVATLANGQVASTKTVVDEVRSLKDDLSNSSVQIIKTEDEDSTVETQIAPAVVQTESKTFVEKKGMFGKSKWVEK